MLLLNLHAIRLLHLLHAFLQRQFLVIYVPMVEVIDVEVGEWRHSHPISYALLALFIANLLTKVC